MSVVRGYVSAASPNLATVVADYADLVRKVALHLASRLPDVVQVDDLMQSGMIGLLEAAKRFDDTHGASFGTYAERRIRGAMIDELRRGDWIPRSVHRTARDVAEAIREIEQQTGREARDDEVAERLGMELSEYQSTLCDLAGQKLLSVESLMEDAPDGRWLDGEGTKLTPEDVLLESDRRTTLGEAIESLPERERLVLALYYNEELNLKEIGAVLDVTESRVSQIRSQALLRLRARLQPGLLE